MSLIIEYLDVTQDVRHCDMLGRRVNRRAVVLTTINELRVALQEEWLSILYDVRQLIT